MLQSIREKSQGWLAWIIVGVVCFVFAIWGVQSYLYSGAQAEVVAKVNGIKITQQQLTVSYNQLRRQQQLQLGQNFSSMPSGASAILKKVALQSLISSAVLTQSARELDFSVGPTLIEVALSKMPIFQVEGVFSKARFLRILNNMLYSPDDFLEHLGRSMLVDQMRIGISESAFALPDEVNQIISLVNQRRDFSYSIIPMSRFISKVKLTAKQEADYYKQNQDDYKIPEAVSIEYVMLSVGNLMKKIHPTDSQLKQFYQDNLTSYSKPKQYKLGLIFVSSEKSKTKLNTVLDLLKHGKDFSQVARQYSDDTASAKNGGVMNWTTITALGSELRSAVVRLKNPGDVALPIETERGSIIIKLLQLRSPKVTPYEQVKNKVFGAYRQQKAEQQFTGLSDQLANITYENPNSLKEVSKTLSLSVQSTKLFTQKGKHEGVLANSNVVIAAFGNDVLTQGNNSNPINLKDDAVMVLRVKQHRPASVKPFNTVRATIIHKLSEDLARDKIKAYGNSLVGFLNKNHSLNQIAHKNQLTWKSEHNVTRHAAHINQTILLSAFEMPIPLGNVPQNAGVSLPSGDFVLIHLTKIRKGSVKELLTATRHQYEKSIQKGFGLVDYQLYVENLMKTAKIEHFEKKQNPDE